MDKNEIDQRVEAIRHFNRLYTRQIGLLTDQYLDSPFSVSEARVIYELAHLEQATATELGSQLRMDAGYLSRILNGFKKRGLIDKTRSISDARKSLVQLTPAGQESFALINARSHRDIEAMLAQVSNEDQKRLVEAMRTIESVLGAPAEQKVPYILRPHQPGDMGWVVYRHAVLYAEEYGWDETFEALTAEIVAHFIQAFDPKREHCWIAERDGENIGSVFLVKQSETVGKLRLLLVEPKARGLGVGSRLVEECIRFARKAKYQKLVLWTNSVLVAARYIYQKAGFKLVEAEPHHSFGHDLVGETWELDL